MPLRAGAENTGYYNASAECWTVFTEVLAPLYPDALLAAEILQLTVDAYAVQHAGGPQPSKSVGVHLYGLYLALERGAPLPAIPAVLQRLGIPNHPWPELRLPPRIVSPTIFDVAIAGSRQEQIEIVRRWAAAVWRGWSAYHDMMRTLGAAI